MSDYGTAEEGPSSEELEFHTASEGYSGNTQKTSPLSSTKRSSSLPGSKGSSPINLEEINLEEKEPDLEDLYDLFCYDEYQNRGIVKLQDIQEAHTHLSQDKSIIYSSDKGKFKYKSNSISAAQCPGYFQYNGIPLNIVEYISSGSYGYVIRLSSETELPLSLIHI